MTKRQPAEKICKHYDWPNYMAAPSPKPCKAGVEYASVSHGPEASQSIASLPCYGMCDAATCDKKKLREVKSEKVKPKDAQGLLF